MLEIFGNIIAFIMVGTIFLIIAYLVLIALPVSIYRGLRQFIRWFTMTPKERERYRKMKRRKRRRYDGSSDSGSSSWWFSSDSASGCDSSGSDGGGGGGGD